MEQPPYWLPQRRRRLPPRRALPLEARPFSGDPGKAKSIEVWFSLNHFNHGLLGAW